MRRRRSRRDAAERVEVPSGVTELAWRVHAAQQGWASTVDIKVSILLALQAGMLFAVISVHSPEGLLSQLSEWRKAIDAGGIVLLLAAIAASAAALYPRLGRAFDHTTCRAGNYIYFGHLRQWTARELKDELEKSSADVQLSMLALQLVRMSKINWRKHRLSQLSIILALASLTCFVVATIEI